MCQLSYKLSQLQLAETEHQGDEGADGDEDGQHGGAVVLGIGICQPDIELSRDRIWNYYLPPWDHSASGEQLSTPGMCSV